jgi:hypothetical protein
MENSSTAPFVPTAPIQQTAAKLHPLAVFHSLPVHLARQPFSSIHSYLNMERKPGLQARLHPPHFRIDLVVIEDLARPHAAHQVRASMLEGKTWFYRAERAH